ncbi:helix-turn-helix domain-containing protein [Micromonospora sp. Llam0]|uniref:helix-turn-helix domain-containing protein n=1 Tax=Micromonospora sp. Llam0 TaxID=2485143 RepID=UPI000F46D572|nr:helix-turn-helix domain-containing protein [Micromonospora sp. Llam0]
MTPGRRITGDDRTKCRTDFAQLYHAGYPIRRIARETNRSYGFVRQILTEANVTFRTRGRNGEPSTPGAANNPKTTDR